MEVSTERDELKEHLRCDIKQKLNQELIICSAAESDSLILLLVMLFIFQPNGTSF